LKKRSKTNKEQSDLDMNLVDSCIRCERLKHTRNCIVYGYGDPNAELMFVGMAPGRNGADRTGVPFTRDPSGVLFQECLIKAGFSSENNPRNEKPRLKNVYVTNLVKCNPKDNEGRNRTPSLEEIKNCSYYFEHELIDIDPKIVVLFGKVVNEFILKKKISKFIEVHNKHCTFGQRVFIPFIHPSYVIRGAYNRQQYIHEIIGLRQFLQ
jgi:uracil-DNA glycosylase family 4